MDVKYKHVKPYNTKKMPCRQPFWATAAIAFLSRVCMLGTKYTIDKQGMEALKPPYILLSNHMYFVDFYLCAMATFPHRLNNIATIDGYYRRPFLMEMLGCICKRKFTTDLHLFRAINHVLKKHGDVLCMYPEARYSPIGTTAILPDSLGKMIKLSGVPVAVLLHHGNYLHTPFWNYRKPRKVPLHTTIKQVLSAQQVKEMTAREINEVIRREMSYDEYRWQRENKIKIDEPFRAEGLHKVLYQCPACQTEHEMASNGSEIFCKACGKAWEMDEYGVLHAKTGETEFAHIPDWFEWERAQVRSQIENGQYHFEDEVEVYSLPGAMRFIPLGKAKLTHSTENGLVLEGHYNGAPYRIVRDPRSMYGLHVEYDYCYIKPFDCIDISTENDSFYCYPKKQNVITKLSFAVEEIFKHYQER